MDFSSHEWLGADNMPILGAFAVPHPPIIMPEVGHGEEKKIQATIDAYRTAMQQAAALKPDTVIITSPHTTMYADYFHISPGAKASGNFAAFRAPQVEIEVTYDTELIKALSAECDKRHISAGTLGERNASLDHGTLIPLRFLGEYTTSFNVVRIGLSGLSAATHYALGKCIADVVDKLGRRAVFIASGDLSHKLKPDGPYGFAKEGPLFDTECVNDLATADFLHLLSIDAELAEGAAECGVRSFWIMSGALDCREVKGEKLSYEGTFGVGYGVITFALGGKDSKRNIGEQYTARQQNLLEKRKASEDTYVKLARLSVETFVRTRTPASMPDNLPTEMLSQKAGAFVSLKKDGRLRGCIGTFLPTTDSIAQEILRNGIAACSQDPRFSPVAIDELDSLVYSVDILSAPEKITSPAELDVKRYGVIVSCGNRRGLLLPDLAGVDTVDQQIAIARNKGNIRENEPIELQRFEVVRHK